MPSCIVPAHAYRRERWRNGLGWTREILCLGTPTAWTLRLSIAEIEQDAAFSAFPGVERELVLLRGNGLRLRFGDGRSQDVSSPYAHARFAGDEPICGELLDGPTQDFNLMWRRDRLVCELAHQTLAATLPLVAEPRTAWAIHLLSGHAKFGGDSDLAPLATGDTAWLSADTCSRHVLEGNGELLAIRIRSVA